MTAQTVSDAVAQRDEEIGPIKFMWSKRSHLRTVLPKSVDVEAFLGTAAGALYASDIPGKNLTLMRCAQQNPESLFVALLECAALGHMPGTDEYYLTPRMDHGRPKVLGIEGYKGVVERMYRGGAVANVVVREVCEKDYFDYREGEMDKPVHRFGGQGTTGAAFFAGAAQRGEMVGGYAYAHLVTGAVSRVVILTRDDVFAARDSGGYKPTDGFSPWNRMDGGENHPEFKGRSMWWKTFAKRLEPWVPTSAEYRRESLRASASAAEHAISHRQLPELPAGRTVDTGTGEIVDAEIVDTPDVPPAPPQPPPAAATTAGPAAAANGAGGTPDPDSRATAAQVTRIIGHCKRLGWGESADDLRDRVRAVSGLLSLKDVTPFDKLTSGDADDAAAELAKFADGDAQGVWDLINDGVMPDGQ